MLRNKIGALKRLKIHIMYQKSNRESDFELKVTHFWHRRRRKMRKNEKKWEILSKVT